MTSSEKRAVVELSRLATWRWVAAALGHWAVIAAALWAARQVDHRAFDAAAIVLLASQIHGITVLGHEGAHWHVVRNRRWNDALTTWFCFLPFGFDLASYRRWHLDHHQNLGTAEDAELLTVKRWLAGKYSLPRTRGDILRRALLGLVGFELSELVVTAYLFRPARAVDGLKSLAFFTVAGLAVRRLHLGREVALLAISLVTVVPVLNYLRTLFEHTGSASTNRLRLSRLEAFFLGPHHVLEHHFEHHAWPSIPFYNLPAARRLDEITPVLSLAEQVESFAHPATDAPETA